ncbi:protein kinase domain-containing protein [Streptomyces lasiicapitis]|uniref:protein kinase domain-containing protein n=1 Tax=Streptomyces lasiicapitis TaxID=1923961 RepID=UPI00368F8D70
MTPPMAIGKLLESDPRRIGPYRLTGVLGRGGMGEVFLARDRRGRQVAVKRMRPSMMHAREARRRFAREVMAARTVDSPLVAKVLDAAPEAAQPWLATEYVPGVALSEAVETYGPLPEEYVRDVGRQLTDALAAIHRAGLVHRDFKPSNVLLSAGGPRVLDFGLARHLHASTFTTSQEFLGTPAYAAPEQWDAANITPAADVFSLASTLVYALRKRAPFEAEDMWRVMYAIRFEEPDLSGLPGGWRRLAATCLAKRPEHRPSLAEVATVLDGFPSTGSSPALPPDGLAALLPAPAGPRPRGVSRRGVMRVGAAVVVGAGVAGLVGGDRRPPAPDAWTFPTKGVVHQVLVADDTLYAADGLGRVYALDARTGRPHWSRQMSIRGARPWLGTLPGRPGLYVTGDRLDVLDSATGEKVWNIGIPALGAPAVSPEAIAFLTRGAVSDELALVDQFTQERVRPRSDGLALSVTDERPSPTAPALYGNTKAVVGGSEGYIYGISLKGKERTFLELPDRDRPSPAAPLVTGGVAYLGTTAKGRIVAVDANVMRLLWVSTLAGPGETWSTPAMSDGTLFVTGFASGVHAVDRATGKRGWTYRPASPTPSSPAVAGDAVYVLTHEGELLALHTGTGDVLARHRYEPFPRGSAPVCAPVTAHGLVHFATADRTIRAVPQARTQAA